MLIDDVRIRIKAGDGGHGAVAFNTAKMAVGPTGADGGRGGGVYLEGVSDLGALIQFRYRKEVVAENGRDGRSKFRDGRDGEDLILRVPVGTVVHNLSTNKNEEVISIGQRLLMAKGGQGGRGNFKFRSSRNTTPKESEPGTAGEAFDFHLELKMIADVGFVGLPNVGKSSLLNALTNAKSRVANYNFTTLEPNLGAYYELILADIPGLIEGASEGRGLGIKFLRHIERTKTIFHLISAESADPAKDYEVIRGELGAYNKELLDKPEYVFLSKADLLPPEEIKKKTAALKAIGKEALAISINDPKSIKKTEEILRQIVRGKISS